MRTTRHARCWFTASLGLALAAATGCQTYVPSASLTLPSGHYLEHPPQYIPPSPAFPLSRELARMQETGGAIPVGGAPVGGGPGGLPAPLPAPAPVGGGMPAAGMMP